MNDKIEYIKKWIEKADHDFGTAKITFLHLPQYKDTICFHFQQAIEKYLKALLVFLDIDFRKTHDLAYLLELLSTKYELKNSFFDYCSELQDFAVEFRYPNQILMPTDNEIKEKCDFVQEIRDFVIEKMNIEIPFDYE